MKQHLFAAVLFTLIAASAFAANVASDPVYWYYGERVSGPEINTAFTQVNAKIATHTGQIASLARGIFYTVGNVQATNTITFTASGSLVRILDNATDSNNLLSITAGTEGQLLHIYNEDASATSGIATISSGKCGAVLYASGSWRLLSDE